MKKQRYRFTEWLDYVKKKDTPLSLENTLYYYQLYNEDLNFETNYINCMKHYGYYIYKTNG